MTLESRQQTKSDLNTSAKYRADINGLRAISIIAVVGYHACPEIVPGGFVGVDVFFVISGFLITGIVTRELATRSFSVVTFYQRRIRRIFPALIAVLSATYLVGWLVLLPDDFKLLGLNIAGGAGFFSNLVQLHGQSYFAPDASTNPLLHLWSLGIEEQFYILWPLLLMLLRDVHIRKVIIAALATASFVLNVYLVRDHQAMAFYSPVTRAWELLAGALLVGSGTRLSPLVRDDAKGVAGLLLIAIAIVCLNRDSKYPGAAALLPVVGAALLISAPNSFVNRRLLAQPAMVLIGLISYPLYLWHWPILSYLGILRAGDPTDLDRLGAVVAAVILAYATYRFVELPIRSRRLDVSGLSLGMAAVAALGVLTVFESGFDIRFPAEIREIADLTPRTKQDNSGFRSNCLLDSGAAFSAAAAECIEPGSAPLLFVWGDSTAAALYPGLKAAQAHRNFRIAQFTHAACAPVIVAGGRTTAACISRARSAFEYVISSRPDIVLLQAEWDLFSDFEQLRATIARLKQIGIPRIVLLGPTPLWKRPLPFMLVNAYRFQHAIPDRIASGVSGPAVDDRMERFSRNEQIEYLSAWRPFCNEQGCLTRVGPRATDVVIWDSVHLSKSGSEFLGRVIIDNLFRPS